MSTSRSGRDKDHSMFTSKTPHFFKIILDQTLRDGKLEIPKRFIRKYGRQLPSLVHLEVPSAEIWLVQLTKRDRRVWLQKGWKEFAKHHSLKFGHFLVFRYEGNALFHVLIFDRTASEIEYPCRGTDDEDDSLGCRKRKKKADKAPCLQPQKKSKVDAPNETGINLKSGILAPARKGKEVMGQKRSHIDIEVTKRARRLSADEKTKALKKASTGFRAKNPFFMVVMQPTHIRTRFRMSIPASFARQHLKIPRGRNVILRISNGKTWRTKFYSNRNGVNPHLRGANWKAFARHNALELGDVCVFELTKRSPEIMLEITIYRVVEHANADRSQEEAESDDESIEILEDIAPSKKMRKRSPIQCLRPLKMTKTSMTNKTETILSSESLASRFRPHGKKAREAKLEKLKGNTSSSSSNLGDGLKLRNQMGRDIGDWWKWPKQAGIVGFKKLSAEEKAETLRIANSFSSKNPFFLSVIRLCNAGKYMGIPNNFAKMFLRKRPKGEAILCLPDGQSWSVKYNSRAHSENNPKAQFWAGWMKFYLDNRLQVGDICVFELLEGAKITLNVVIHRVADVQSTNIIR